TIGWQWKNVGKELLRGGLWAVSLQTIAFVLLLILGMLSVTIGKFDGLELAGFLFFFLLVSINEELIFRGYLTSLLTHTLHFLPAIIVSSLLFAAVHIGNVDFTWMGFGSIFFGGYLLGLLYVKYQNIYLPIGMHWFWNYYHGNVLGFDVSGHQVPAFLQLQMNGPQWVTGGEFGLEGSIITVILLMIVSVYLTWFWYADLQRMRDVNI
ncbi:MAG: CPBP family intramembrane glutamic endopeptidase, partial [Bacteroidota bacterium]